MLSVIIILWQSYNNLPVRRECYSSSLICSVVRLIVFINVYKHLNKIMCIVPVIINLSLSVSP
nr:MAG TPA: hypothetical protein [Bacteriophage sp.]